MYVFKCPNIENILTCGNVKWYDHRGKQFDNFLKRCMCTVFLFVGIHENEMKTENLYVEFL